MIILRLVASAVHSMQECLVCVHKIMLWAMSYYYSACYKVENHLGICFCIINPLTSLLIMYLVKFGLTDQIPNLTKIWLENV